MISGGTSSQPGPTRKTLLSSPPAGPDLALVGAARSGTSALAALLSTHPNIDPGKIKEPNYFSWRNNRGPQWYENLYQPRRAGLFRLDASTSYTSSKYPEALDRLAAAAPGCQVVYAVRRPSDRALSHYLLRHHYFHNDEARDFGAGLAAGAFYLEVGDYSRWLSALSERFGAERVLVVPFELVTSEAADVAAVICREAGLQAAPGEPAPSERHRNNVVQYRNVLTRRAARRLRASKAYPALRSSLGPDRMRRARDLLTRKAPLPSREEALATCSDQQREALCRLDERATAAALEVLRRQDARLGLQWVERSFAHTDG